MMKTKVTLVVLLIFTCMGVATAQSSLTLDDLVPGGKTYRRYVPESRSGLFWLQDVCYEAKPSALLSLSLRGEKVDTLVSLKEVNELLVANSLKKVRSLRGASLVNVAQEPRLQLYTADGFINIALQQKKITQKFLTPAGAEHFDFSANQQELAYTIANNLWVMNAAGEATAITNAPAGIVCGQSVHRNEFGIEKGTFWSPNGEWLAFYQMDESMVSDYPLVDIAHRVAKLEKIKYPMAGMKSHKVRVGLYNIKTQQTHFLRCGDPTNRYFTNISWSPDSKKIYLIELNREQNHSQLIRFDVSTGKQEKVLLEETANNYVEPLFPIYFRKGNDDQFVYISKKSGYIHLYLYDTAGHLIRPLTAGNFEVQQYLGMDEKGKNLYIMSNEPSPLESHLYSVNIKTAKRTRLTLAAGMHQVKMSGSYRYAIDQYSSADVPRVVQVIATKNGAVKRALLTAKDPFAKVEMPTVTMDTLLAADGITPLYYRLIKPVHFDPTKKYPAIVYVYGGPHVQLVHNSFMYSTRGWEIYMAMHGYVVFVLDNRGSEGRGHAFESATFRHLGVEECKDQLKGAKMLQSLPYVDANRIGVHGWSFGGHMTTALMLRYNDVYKVGVAGGPVIDWKYYEVMYGERYMDTPKNNPEGYKATNLNLLAGQLKGKLLLIHDDMDNTCVPQHTLSFLKACIKAHTYPDYFVYPGHRHNVLGPDRVHLHEKISRYFFENL